MKKSTLATGLLFTVLTFSAFAQDKPVLTVYTYDSFSSDWGPGPKIKTAFEAQCDCELKFIATDSSTGILSRVLLEGEKSPADIVLGLDATQLSQAKATGLLAEHGVNMQALKLPIEWNDNIFLPYDYGYFAFIYDETKLATPPTSLDELAASELKVIVQDPRSSTPGLGLLIWIQASKGTEAADYWQALSDNVVTVTKGWSEAYGLFLEGESDMVLSYTTSPAYHQISEQKNQFKAAAFSDGHAIQMEVAAKLKTSAQPKLADQFMAFILSDAFQSLIPTGNWMYPVTNVALPEAFSNLVQPTENLTVDADELQQNKKQWLTHFTQGLAK